MKSTEEIEKLIKNRRYKATTITYEKTLKSFLQAVDNYNKQKSIITQPNIWRVIVGSKVGSLAAALLVISSLAACFILYEKVTNLKDELKIANSKLETVKSIVPAAQVDETLTINFYLKEHEDFIARQASFNSAVSQPVPMHVNQSDIMYYELIDNQPEYMSPGIIVRGPSYQGQISTSQTPAISNGHTLALSEARDTIDFDLVSPSWLFPCYRLDQIRTIEGRDALQLLYTDGINSISLFEQSLDGQRGLSHHDFREYAVYNNQGKDGGNILAWRDDTISYVLIGNTELSQLMSIAQSINDIK